MEKDDNNGIAFEEDVLDDNFSTYTLRRDESDVNNIKADGGKDDGADGGDDTGNAGDKGEPFLKVDLSGYSDEQKAVLAPILKQIEERFGDKVDALQKKAGLVDILLRNNKPSGKENVPGSIDEIDDSELGIDLDIDFEEKDYYAPKFKKLIEAVKQIAKSSKKELSSIKKESGVKEIKSFFRNNPDAVKYAKTMDKLVKETPALLGNLERLYNLAQVEEGHIPKSLINSQKRKPQKGSNNRNLIELSGLGGGAERAPKKINSISDAFAQAERDLASNK